MFKLDIDKTSVRVRHAERLTVGLKGAVSLECIFSNHWANLEVTAIFCLNGEIVDTMAFVPYEAVPIFKTFSRPAVIIPLSDAVTTKEGQVTVGFIGKKDEKVVIPTIWARLSTVVQGAKMQEIDPDDPDKPNPPVDPDNPYIPVPGPQGPQGPQGEPGKDGKDGVSPTVIVTPTEDGHQVTITDVEGAKTFTVKDGENGWHGIDGEDGVSPTLAITPIRDGHKVTITDAEGSRSFDVMNGENGTDGEPGPEGPVGPEGPIGPQGAPGKNGEDGQDGENGTDGFSPVVEVSSIAGGHRVTITDAEGPQSFDVMNGKDGAAGPSTSAGDVYLVKAPVGTIVIWSGTTEDVPKGWALCDGEDGRPDLRDKFVLGAGTNYGVGATGGEENVTLDVSQMPAHSHIQTALSRSVNVEGGTRVSDVWTGTNQIWPTQITGKSQSHNNMPPYYALCYIIKVTADETDGGSSEEVYTTEETRVGTWIDGKPIYRKVFVGTTPTTAGGIFQEFTSDKVATLVDLHATILASDGSWVSVPWYYDPSNYCSIQVHPTFGFWFNLSNSLRGRPVYIIIKYTKPED